MAPSKVSARWMVSLFERDEFRFTCSEISASTISVFGRSRRLAEIDLDDPAAVCVGRGQNFQRIAEPLRRRLGEIQIAIDAIDHALAAERGQPLVDLLADRAEFHIGRVAERQHAEFDAIEARRALAHQLAIGAHRARRRIALAPSGGDEHQPLGGAKLGQFEIGHVNQRRLQAVLARRLRQIVGELLAISGFAGIDNVDRLGWSRRCRLGCGCPVTNSTPARKPAKPGALQLHWPARPRG